jgi:thiamine pyrophosphate-dependent acetolactate synthase large subunit-like protein
MAAEHWQKMAIEHNIEHGGDRIAAALQKQGVPFLFTLCGGHISPILSGAKAQNIRIIDVRDEATAVFAADAVGRLSGLPGVAAVTAGPGLTNSLTALKNALLAQSPMILFGGAAPTALQGRGALQDIKQRPVVMPHVKLVKQIARVRELIPAVEDAFFVACDGVPGPVFIECPIDVLYDETNIRKWYTDATGKGTRMGDRLLDWYLKQHVESIFSGSHEFIPPVKKQVILPHASDTSLSEAVIALAKAERPLMIIGSQALAIDTDGNNLARAVRRLGIPVYLSGMGRGLLGREDPLQMRHQRRQALKDSDCVLLAGVPCDFRLDYGRHIRRSADFISSNRSQQDANMNRKPNTAAIGDVGNFIERLSDQIQLHNINRHDWLKQLRSRDTAREKEIDEDAKRKGEFVNPVALFREIESAADDTAIFVADGGDFVATASYILRPRGPRAWLDPGAFGTLGVGAGFAMGAALCRPQSEIWLIYGDGACGYGLTEFDTFVRHQIPVIAVVGNDAGWTQIAREQVKILKDDVGTVLARTDYHKVAAAFGAEGILVKKQSEVADALKQAKQAFKAGKAVLINVWLDKTDFREGSISM